MAAIAVDVKSDPTPKPDDDKSLETDADSHISMTLTRYSGPSPFKSLTPAGRYERAKIFLMTLFMVPLIRLVLITLCVLLQWIFSLFATICADESKPLPTHRRVWVYPIRFLFRIILFVAGFYWIETTDMRPPGIIRRGNIIVMNHVGLWDMGKIIYDEGAAGLAKSQAFSAPFIGRIMRALQCVPVRREDDKARAAALKAIGGRASDLAYPPLVIFPQGTTTNAAVLTMFKQGAFTPGAAVSPVILRYPNKHFDHFLGSSTMKCVWRTLCQFVNFMSVEYRPEYVPSDREAADPIIYATNVRQLFARELRAQITDHDFNDLRLAKDAAKADLSPEFVMSEASTLLHTKYEDVKWFMQVFKAATKNDPSKTIVASQFAVALGLDDDDVAERLFDLFDTDSNGRLSLSEFVVGMAIASTNCSPKDAAKILFEVCDLNGDRKVSRSELGLSLKRFNQQENDEVYRVLFPGGAQENEVSFDAFVARLSADEAPAPSVLRHLLDVFLWKRSQE